MWALFPWLGSYAFLALERFLKLRCGKRLGLKGMNPSRPYYLQFTMQVGEEEFFQILQEEVEKDFDPPGAGLPQRGARVRKIRRVRPRGAGAQGFALGVLDVEDMKRRVRGWAPEGTPC